MSEGNLLFKAVNGPVGIGIDKVSQWVKYSDFTDGGGQYGTLTMNQKIPAGSSMLFSRVKIEEAFNGGTNNLKIGKSSGEDEFCDGANLDLSLLLQNSLFIYG